MDVVLCCVLCCGGGGKIQNSRKKCCGRAFLAVLNFKFQIFFRNQGLEARQLRVTGFKFQIFSGIKAREAARHGQSSRIFWEAK